MEKWNTPLYNAIKEYAGLQPVPFHMPGHKMGRGIPGEFLENIAMLDLTEIPGTDNLHFPEGPIKEAQELAARAFAADRTFFLVNGSTCGIHAIIMTLCKPGDKLIVSRDCHKSVISGMMLAGVNPVYIKPQYNSRFGISSVLMPSDVDEALRENPDAAGVLITRPTYYGVCSDIEQITRIVHSYGKVIAVDEAHGAHLCFNDRLPESAMQAGVDICVQSAHKTLPALTQCAYLHVKSHNVDIDRLRFYLSILQTSSPSYIFMASLDMVRFMMERDGKAMLDTLLEDMVQLGVNINNTDTLKVLGINDIKNGLLDMTRLVVNTRNIGITGFSVEKILREEYGIQVEMSDFYNVVCIATVADRKTDLDKLAAAFLELGVRYDNKEPLPDIPLVQTDIPEQCVGLKGIMNYKNEYMALDKAVGRVCADIITPYPPGIPVICPGEVITREVVELLLEITGAGGNVNGMGINKEIRVI